MIEMMMMTMMVMETSEYLISMREMSYVITKQDMRIMRDPLEDHLLQAILVDKVHGLTIMSLWRE